MHAVGLHSALAIKRQRKRRDEQKRARERRYSSQSTESGLGESRSSIASPRTSIGKSKKVNPDKVVSTVGLLHIGVVFLVLGLFLVGAGLIPDDWDNWDMVDHKWFNELVVSGVASGLVGIFLIVLNSVVMRKEEEDLTEYVQRQLTRSKSGHRLVRDLETGCLTTKLEKQKGDDGASLIVEADKCNGLVTPPVHHSPTLKSPPPLSVSTPRSDLERILEEEFSEKGDDEASKEARTRYYSRTHSKDSSQGNKYFNNLDIDN
ncbi:hypothetical protein AAG570_005481 [Ranatra chinensis]|uniref:Uncharacterized protein n=1 Tax=Ranatra chinensis TaxID=642074 RepID=A0ABD0XXK0_9HEMI